MLASESRIELPAIPADQAGLGVAAWAEPVVIDTYEPDPPDHFPAYLDTRVYQGSSGRVYPLPFHERISATKFPRLWSAIHLENKWLRVMVLPELGGRIHVGYDKVRGEDFFYRNNVIKPALVGLAGPWLSGGVEFNWPQHHRPATYLPTDTSIERGADGSVTVWCSDHEPFNRMKGMHGIRLHPDRAVIEVVVRLYNRTDATQTFLWWANVAARVHDDYQSFFPPDVHYVADHAKRVTTTFPRVRGEYYGVDYAARVDGEHPDADRLDWYRNIPVPTSYMCVGSSGDFFGGYDHRANLGFVHWADHHISPGKKQWTWGNAPFGWAWDAQLTDGDGPYVELMAGVYTDNQPDFSFLTPGETKSFSQYWYPIHDIGPAGAATLHAAASLTTNAKVPGKTSVRVGVSVTSDRPGTVISLLGPGSRVLHQRACDLEPGVSASFSVEVVGAFSAAELAVVAECEGLQLVRLAALPADERPAPESATEPPAPEAIESIEELFLTGLHLEQYRHATRSPERYWREALRRDPLDSRVNVALAARLHRRGRYREAEELLQRAISRLTSRNPNPAVGEAHYQLGLTLIQLGRTDQAYDMLAKAAWNAAWRAPAHYALARLDCISEQWAAAEEHLLQALGAESDHLQAADLLVLVLRRLGLEQDARKRLSATRALDPLDSWALDLAGERLSCDAQTLLDVALDYAGAGFWAEALAVLDRADSRAETSPVGAGAVRPLIGYHRAHILRMAGRANEAHAAALAASRVASALCLPGRSADALVLRAAIEAQPGDARAAGLLGHWLYAQDRHADAIDQWQRSADLDPSDPVIWRNLGLAAINVQGDLDAAGEHYRRALVLASDDPRLWFEADQLAALRGKPVDERVATLAVRPEIVARRDDLSAAFAELLVLASRPDEALSLLAGRVFQPWEGGEGRVLEVWEAANARLGRSAMGEGRAADALECFEAALNPPIGLGEARHLLVNSADLYLALGDAQAAAGSGSAKQSWLRAATFDGDFQNMSSNAYSEMTYFSVVACRRLGHDAQAAALLEGLAGHIERLRESPAVVDYFATSLPAMLLFHEDLQATRAATVLFLSAQLRVLRGDRAGAMSRLNQVLFRNPAHRLALDLQQELDAGRMTDDLATPDAS
ncbi:tetratricopeptide (TPR) repeat protein [Nakamurella sp. UYEF19]|uniref:tetratricopeptide repeat protein n=1 Tax=Nakamurella sp. UYEF19 TaxID=1756392 RepID=UPI003391066E